MTVSTAHFKKWLGLTQCFSNIDLYGNRALEVPITNLIEEYKHYKVRLDMTLAGTQDSDMGSSFQSGNRQKVEPI